MNVLFDLPRFSDRPLGQQIYIHNVLSAMLKVAPEDAQFALQVVGLRGIGTHLRQIEDLTGDRKARSQWVPLTLTLYRKLMAVPLVPRLLNSRFQIVHSLTGLPLPSSGAKLLLTIQDVIPLRLAEHSEQFSQWLRQTWRAAREHCDKIITISEFSKAEIVELLDLSPDKITVINNGVDHSRFRPASQSDLPRARARLEQLGIDKPYILQLGGLVPRKNYCRTVESFDLLRQRREIEHKLVFAGCVNVPSDLSRRIAASKFQHDIITLPYLNNADALTLLQNAAVLAFPSTYEGFGMPPLEAMACAVPVALSHAASMPEVGGNAALYFDPDDAEAMAQAILRLLTESDTRRKCIEEGLQHSKKFTWEQNARKTFALYDTLCG